MVVLLHCKYIVVSRNTFILPAGNDDPYCRPAPQYRRKELSLWPTENAADRRGCYLRPARFALCPVLQRQASDVPVYLEKYSRLPLCFWLFIRCGNRSVSGTFGAPELIAAAVVVLVHVKTAYVSIAAGTITYMLLVQFVFL